MTYDISPGLRQAQQCCGVKLVNGIPTLLIGSPTAIHIYRNNKISAQIHFYSITKMNDNINMDSTIAGLANVPS